MMTYECCMMLDLPTLGVPRGAECLGTNVVFVNTSQNFIFHSSLSFVFPPFSRDISLHLNIVAGSLTQREVGNAWRQIFVSLCYTKVFIVSSRHATQAV